MKRRVLFAVFEDFQSLDLAGPHEVFRYADRLAGGYHCDVVAVRPGPVTSSGGLPVLASHGVRDAPGDVDTLMVVGGRGVDVACGDTELTGWIAATAVRARRVASVCSGAFLLAAAGLLAGRRVTTHWQRAAQLAAAHPDVRVDPDPVFLRDGRVWTSAGVTAGMDLALALVEDDLGRDVAHQVARQLVMFLRRPGSQSQFSVPLWTRQPTSDPVRSAVHAVHADPGERHALADLAALAGLSPRHFQRRFSSELGLPPAAYVERVRVEAAQRALAEGADPVEVVARRAGLGSAETLRRVFHRHVGVTPTEYRARFRSAHGPDHDGVRAAQAPDHT
ncbi:GlxA family transcriptional regulator [Streptomyces sp. NPDC059740]|uniref:GlxA family transcriptional regulator n=1 Tax=Streptomyces sp. NPDC059740 TaxID=3346926 RepID=UPI0036601407